MDEQKRILTKVSNIIEQGFETTVLRKSVATKESPFFGGYQFMRSHLIRDIYDSEYKHQTYKTDDDSHSTSVLMLFVPIDEDFIILDNNLGTKGKRIDLLIFYLYSHFNILSYIGGTIKMSYKMQESISSDSYYGTADTLLRDDVYDVLGQVTYARILIYM